MTVDEQILSALDKAFPDARAKVINESHLHAGHAGDDGSGHSHFRVVLSVQGVEGKTRISRHRAVHAALGTDLIGRIHALAIEFV